MRKLILGLIPLMALSQTAKFPSAVVTDADLLVQRDRAQSVLASNISATSTVIPVEDGSRFAANMVVTIDDEQIRIGSVAGNNLIVAQRGFAGTQPAAHGKGSLVRAHVIAWHHNALREEVKAIEQALGANLANVAKRNQSTADRLAVWQQGGALGSSSVTESTSEVSTSKNVNAPIWDKGGAVFNVKAFGAKGDGSTNDRAAIQAAIDAAPVSARIYFPAGEYLINSPLSITKSLALEGAALHPASIYTSSTANATVFSVNTDSPVHFRNLNLVANLDVTAGGLISVSGPGDYGSTGTTIEHCWFYGGNNHVSITKGIQLRVQDSKFHSWYGNAVYMDHPNPDTGGLLMSGSFFSWSRTSSSAAIRVINAVAVRAINNFFLNVGRAVSVERNTTVGSYLFDFSNNFVDGIKDSAVRVASSGTGGLFNVTVSGNSIASGSTSDNDAKLVSFVGTVHSGTVSGNAITCRGAVSQVGVQVDTERGGFSITGNTFTNCLRAVVESVDNDTIEAGFNSYLWLGGYPVAGSGRVVATGGMYGSADLGSANLANGSEVYCYNCQRTDPCSGGGSGAFARRINGQWVCSEGGGGVGGSGTPGKVPLWTGSMTLGDSSLSETDTAVSVSKALEVSTSGDGELVLRSTAGGSVKLAPPQISSDVTVTVPESSGMLVIEGHQHDASDIASGTLTIERGGTGRSSWTPNRCVQVDASGNLDVASGPCSTGGFDPLDEENIWIREDFFTAATASPYIGAYGWSSSCAGGGSISHVPRTGSSPHKKAIRMTTAASSGTACQIMLGSIGSSATALGALASYAPWDSVITFRHSSAASSNTIVFVGYMVGGSTIPTSGSATGRFGLELDTVAGDTNFMFVACNGSACTRSDSGVSADGAWHRLRIRSSQSGALLFSLDGGAETAISTNLPASAQSPTIGVRTAEAVAKQVDTDRFYWYGTNAQ